MASRLKDYTGNKFNHLTIIKELGGGKVLCKCDCGTEVIKYKESVIKGELISCGCITRNGVNRDLSGQRFGKLTAIKPVDEKYYKFLCHCDCGNEIEVKRGHLVSGDTLSCGCLKASNMKNTQRKTTFDGTAIFAITNGKPNKNNSTGVKGVCFVERRKKYQAYITIKRKQIALGYYSNLEDARKARVMAEEKYFAPIINKYKSENKSRGRKIKSYVGKKYNHLTIIAELGKGYVKAKCDCGNIIKATKSNIIYSQQKKCCSKNCPYKEKKYNRINIENIIGKKYNHLTILDEFTEKNSKRKKFYKVHCRCDCGNIIEAEKYNVLSGHTKSCGCLKKKQKPILNNITGKKINRLTVLKELGGNKILCRCDCGTEKILNKYFVINGIVKSCGCLRKELTKELTKKRKRKQKEQE